MYTQHMTKSKCVRHFLLFSLYLSISVNFQNGGVNLLIAFDVDIGILIACNSYGVRDHDSSLHLSVCAVGSVYLVRAMKTILYRFSHGFSLIFAVMSCFIQYSVHFKRWKSAGVRRYYDAYSVPIQK